MPKTKLIGLQDARPSENEALIAAQQQLAAQNLALAQEIQNRSLPRLGEMCDAINAFVGNTKRGNLAAKEVLRRFYKAFDEGRAAAAGIELPDGVIPNQSATQQDGT